MAPKSDTHISTTAVVVPSADLITYRFDQLDTAVASLNDKVDKMSYAYVPKEEYVLLTRQVADLQKSHDNQNGEINANRRFVNVALTLLSIVVAGVAIYAGIHKK